MITNHRGLKKPCRDCFFKCSADVSFQSGLYLLCIFINKQINSAEKELRDWLGGTGAERYPVDAWVPRSVRLFSFEGMAMKETILGEETVTFFGIT